MSTFRPPDEFFEGARALAIDFERGDVERLARYLQLLLAANERFNLTAITEPNTAWRRHILDSLTLVPWLVSVDARRVIDIGSGGGLPGLPLAIVLPKVRFTLLEATGKKASFLQETARALQLVNVEVINDRAETLGHDVKHREQYDVAMARAVGRLAVLVELTTPFTRVGGVVLAMKGEQAESEIAEAKQALYMLHAQVVDRRATESGVIVVVEKQRKTPRAYPRGPGDPKRAPLGLRTGDAPA